VAKDAEDGVGPTAERSANIHCTATVREGLVTFPWSSSPESWQALQLDLQLQAEALFASTGQIIRVALDNDSGSVVTLTCGCKSLRITWVPERNSVRWDTEREYSFERAQDTASPASKLMRRVR